MFLSYFDFHNSNIQPRDEFEGQILFGFSVH